MASRRAKFLVLAATIVAGSLGLLALEPDPTTVAGPIGDCNSSDRQRRIDGCTALIASGDLQGSTLAVALSLRADALVGDKQWDRAIEDLRQVKALLPDDPQTKFRLSEVLTLRASTGRADKRWATAVTDYELAIAEVSSNVEAWHGLVATLYEWDHLEEAISQSKKAFSLLPLDGFIRLQRSTLLRVRAQTLGAGGNLQAVIENLDMALVHGGSERQINRELARAYLSASELSKAHDTIAKNDGVGRNRDDMLISAQILIAMKNPKLAMTEIEGVLSAYPNSGVALALRAVAKEMTGDLDGAQADYRQAAVHDRDIPVSAAKRELRLQIRNDDSTTRTFLVVGDGERQVRSLKPSEQLALSCVAPCHISFENGEHRASVGESGTAFSFQFANGEFIWLETPGAVR